MIDQPPLCRNDAYVIVSENLSRNPQDNRRGVLVARRRCSVAVGVPSKECVLNRVLILDVGCVYRSSQSPKHRREHMGKLNNDKGGLN